MPEINLNFVSKIQKPNNRFCASPVPSSTRVNSWVGGNENVVSRAASHPSPGPPRRWNGYQVRIRRGCLALSGTVRAYFRLTLFSSAHMERMSSCLYEALLRLRLASKRLLSPCGDDRICPLCTATDRAARGLTKRLSRFPRTRQTFAFRRVVISNGSCTKLLVTVGIARIQMLGLGPSVVAVDAFGICWNWQFIFWSTELNSSSTDAFPTMGVAAVGYGDTCPHTISLQKSCASRIRCAPRHPRIPDLATPRLPTLLDSTKLLRIMKVSRIHKRKTHS